RRISLELDADTQPLVHRVINLDDLANDWLPELRYLVLVSSADEKRQIEALRRSGLNNILQVSSEGLLAGDVVIPDVKNNQIFVLYREPDSHHS
ncbi:hypothetical protein, partial [Vibrio parahaemolyticus]|uniref:hypothetical protein n=1 Tax=Vibrio parahaemolyticus TaxID=670 RepID=UPI002111BC67